MANLKEISEMAKNLTQASVTKAKEVGEVAKLNLDNVSEQEKIKKAYTEIGKLYVSLHQGQPEEAYEALFHKIDEARGKIETNKARIARLKAENGISV